VAGEVFKNVVNKKFSVWAKKYSFGMDFEGSPGDGKSGKPQQPMHAASKFPRRLYWQNF